MTTVVHTAVTEDGRANWPAVYDAAKLDQPLQLVQYCHGAPGMVIALASLPKGVNEQFDRILEQGGELTWQAGPLKKGSNLCHGTGGNGYAFLKLFIRTGDQMWLDRARAFAMHAIEQYQLSKKLYGQLRYPLWTGDLGLAIYLWDCLQAQAKFPTVDLF
ncbi:MAG: LanC-like protein [Cyanobacteria bacterium P01_C01_bin.118]